MKKHRVWPDKQLFWRASANAIVVGIVEATDIPAIEGLVRKQDCHSVEFFKV
jgi:hypothetical protein